MIISVAGWFGNRPRVALFCALALCLIVVVVPITLARKGVPEWMNPEIDTNVTFVSREEWEAKPPADPLSNLTESPAPYVIICHTVTPVCFDRSICAIRLRTIQILHINYGWGDIGYNFLVGGDGLAYVGRGWDTEGAHTIGWNRNSIAIAFIGDFSDIVPSDKQLLAARKVIAVGLKLGKITTDYELVAHRQVLETESPGDQLYKIVKTWDHWSATPGDVSSSPTLVPSRTTLLLFSAFFAHFRIFTQTAF